MFKKFIFILALAGGSWLGACRPNTAETTGAATETAETTSTPDTAATAQLAYICPMKCEGSASHEPGKCPVCAMELVKNPNYKEPAAPAKVQ